MPDDSAKALKGFLIKNVQERTVKIIQNSVTFEVIKHTLLLRIHARKNTALISVLNLIKKVVSKNSDSF